MAEREYLLKICIFCYPDRLLSPSLFSYADGGLDPLTKSTTGVNILPKQITVVNANIKLILTDLSTNPVFKVLYPNHIRSASAVVFAFSKSNHKFFDSAIALYHWFKQHIPHPVPAIAFLGLHSDPEIVSQKDGQALAQELSVAYFELAVDDLQTFDAVVRSLFQKVLLHKGESV